MSARDDYRIAASANAWHHQWSQMCDEIDRLRIKVGGDDRLFKAMEAPLNELVRELTAHADAMRELLYHLVDDRPSRKIVTPADMLKAITAYDNFVKEC